VNGLRHSHQTSFTAKALLACFALAMLSKESAVVFFPLVLLGDYAVGKWKPRIRYALAAGLALLYLGLLWKVQGGRFGPAEIPMVDNPLAHRACVRRAEGAHGFVHPRSSLRTAGYFDGARIL